MRAVILFTLCLAAVSAVPKTREPQRIVGGTVTTIETWPQMVAMLYTWDGNSYWQSCGASILNNRSVLTAAHCTFNTNVNWRWRLRVGSTWANSGGVVHNTAQIIMHPNYNPVTDDNDVAVLRSATTFSLNNAARPASIAGANYNLADNQVVWATGWGATSQGGPSSEQLHQVQIWTVNQSTCRNRYVLAGRVVTDNMLCSGWLDVGGRDQCQGDSGGPLFHNGVVVGVCSWGSGCAQAFFPGVNARVSRFISWIQSNA